MVSNSVMNLSGTGSPNVQKGIYGYLQRKRLYPNMLCAHPPFQIDGNFGFAAAVAEMLVQSRKGHILLLPALPDEWKDGKVRGLKAQDDITVDFEWRDCRIHRVRLSSPHEQKLTLECNGVSKTVFLKPDGTEDVIFNGNY